MVPGNMAPAAQIRDGSRGYYSYATRICNQRDLGPLAMPHSSCVRSVADSMDARS